MKKSILAILLFFCFTSIILGQNTPPKFIPIWPDKAPGETTPIRDDPIVDDNGNYIMNIRSRGTPMIQIYSPERKKNTGLCMVVFPGGGYGALMTGKPRWEICQEFQKMGITAVMLMYRVPRRQGQPIYNVALQDAQRTISYLRANAQKLGIDPKRIGTIGFSAGGHLSVMSAVSLKRIYKPVDKIDEFDFRANFAVPVYPFHLLDKEGNLDPVVTIDETTPPFCIFHGQLDKVASFENSIKLYEELSKKGIDADLHIYTKGQHSFYALPYAPNRTTGCWNLRLYEWLRFMKFL